MTIRHVVALMGKDLRIHWKGVAAAHAGVLAMTALGIVLGSPDESGLLLGFVTNLNFLCALLWGEWFVSREKTKGSFAWLRTLPISATSLCLSKFAISGACVVSLWTLSSMVFLRDDFRDAPAIWVVEQVGLLLFSTTVVASRMLLRQKLAQVMPVLLLLPVVLLALTADQYDVFDAALRYWATLQGKLAVALALTAGCCGVCAFTIRQVAGAETRRLVE